MFVVPESIPEGDKSLRVGYACPVCKHQTYPSKTDTGWVLCPLIRNRSLCLGCCIDLQGAAVAEDFQRHSDNRLFEKLSTSQNKTVVRLRLICLDHQLELVDRSLASPDDGRHTQRRELRARIVLAKDHAASEGG